MVIQMVTENDVIVKLTESAIARMLYKDTELQKLMVEFFDINHIGELERKPYFQKWAIACGRSYRSIYGVFNQAHNIYKPEPKRLTIEEIEEYFIRGRKY